MNTVVLGEVELPSGIMVVLDPGLGRFWCHDASPDSPLSDAPPMQDLEIVGPDAVAAAHKYDRQFDPRYLFDIPDSDGMVAHFAAFCREHGFDARAVIAARRITHFERAHSALVAGDGLGVVQYNGLWGVVVGRLPTGRRLSVVGYEMDGDEFAGRFRTIEIIADAAAPVAHTRTIQGVMVDHGELMCVGLEPLGAFRMWQSLDGLADFVFRGRDAAALAAQVGAPALDDDWFGWRNLPMGEVERHAAPLQARIEQEQLAVAVDYRPHDNLERLNAQVRASDERSGVIRLDGVAACGFDNRWGDGLIDVVADYDAEGRVVRVRLDVGNEAMQTRLRALLA